MYLNEIYSKVRLGKHLSHNFSIQYGLKQGDALSPLLFNFTLEYANRKVQENQQELKLNERLQLLAYADDVTLLGDNITSTNKNMETLIDVGLEIMKRKLNIFCCLVATMQVKIVTQIATDHLKMCHSSNIWERQ
jgi:hypothetical protein